MQNLVMSIAKEADEKRWIEDSPNGEEESAEPMR